MVRRSEWVFTLLVEPTALAAGNSQERAASAVGSVKSHCVLKQTKNPFGASWTAPLSPQDAAFRGISCVCERNGASTKRNLTCVTLRLGSDVLYVWHCLESDVVANPQDHPRFQAVFVGQTPSVSALALLDVVVVSCPMEDFSTTSNGATQPLHFKVCADRRKNRLVLEPA